MIESIFQEALIQIKQVHQKDKIFTIIGIFWIKTSTINNIFAMDVMI